MAQGLDLGLTILLLQLLKQHRLREGLLSCAYLGLLAALRVESRSFEDSQDLGRYLFKGVQGSAWATQPAHRSSLYLDLYFSGFKALLTAA